MGLISFKAENASKNAVVRRLFSNKITKSLFNNNIVSRLTFFKKGDIKAKMMLSRDEDKK